MKERNATLSSQEAVHLGDEIVRSYRFTDPTTPSVVRFAH